MTTANRFSNPDTPAGDCLYLYAQCLVIKPIQAIVCLPFACCAVEHRNRKEQREVRGEMGAETVEEQPPAAVPMGDASLPRDQWLFHSLQRTQLGFGENVMNDGSMGRFL